jgi:hypothetical protein
MGLKGCALDPGHKQEDGSLWDTDTLPSIYEGGTMEKAEWRNDPRREGGGNTSCVSIMPGTTNQWCAIMCSDANPKAPDGSEASCPSSVCACTAEARKALIDERDEVLANWKEAESRVRGAKPLTAYPDGLPPSDLEGDDPSVPVLPKVARTKARSQKPETCRSIKLPATDKWCINECSGIECPADTCECDDYNAASQKLEKESGVGPKSGMEIWREGEEAAKAADNAARYPDGKVPPEALLPVPEGPKRGVKRMAASKDPESCKSIKSQVSDAWCGMTCATERCPPDMCECSDTAKQLEDEAKALAAWPGVTQPGDEVKPVSPADAPAEVAATPAPLTVIPDVVVNPLPKSAALDWPSVSGKEPTEVPKVPKGPPKQDLDPYWADPAPAAKEPPVPAGLTEPPKQDLDVGVPAGLTPPSKEDLDVGMPVALDPVPRDLDKKIPQALDPYWADPAPAERVERPSDRPPDEEDDDSGINIGTPQTPAMDQVAPDASEERVERPSDRPPDEEDDDSGINIGTPQTPAMDQMAPDASADQLMPWLSRGEPDAPVRSSHLPTASESASAQRELDAYANAPVPDTAKEPAAAASPVDTTISADAAVVDPLASIQTTDDSCRSLVVSTNDFWCATQCANDRSPTACPPEVCKCGSHEQEDHWVAA